MTYIQQGKHYTIIIMFDELTRLEYSRHIAWSEKHCSFIELL